MTNYILYGAGDFAVEIAGYVLDVARHDIGHSHIVSDVVSPSISRRSDIENVLEYAPRFHKEVGTVEELRGKQVLVCIGDATARQRVLEELDAAGASLATLIHPTAHVAGTARIGAGVVICPFGFVGAFADVGRNCAINAGAGVGHDVVLGDSSILSPGACINGHGRTGVAAFLGANATINPKSALGRYSKLTAGSVLTKAVGDGFLMHGNPADGRQMTRVP